MKHKKPRTAVGCLIAALVISSLCLRADLLLLRRAFPFSIIFLLSLSEREFEGLSIDTARFGEQAFTVLCKAQLRSETVRLSRMDFSYLPPEMQTLERKSEEAAHWL
ncbi:MAG: hypothetical protein AAGL17_19535, partial [Cyanobacteria bacterium J06576_12]